MELAVEHRTPPSPSRDDAVRNLLEQLGERVKPISLAQERTLPVIEALRSIFPEGGLVRGRVMSCRGVAATTVAAAIVRDAVVGGAWLAVVDVDTFGADAVAELGIPLERVVRIDAGCGGDAGGGSELDWIDVMGAAVDGFDVVVTRMPAGLCGDRRPAAVRKLAARLQQRGTVIVTLGASGALTCDVELRTPHTTWSGLGEGSGHLRRRRVDIEASGRRVLGTRRCSLMLDGSNHRVEIAEVSEPDTHTADGLDPQAELLTEMTQHLDAGRTTDAPADTDTDAGVARLAG